MLGHRLVGRASRKCLTPRLATRSSLHPLLLVAIQCTFTASVNPDSFRSQRIVQYGPHYSHPS